MPKWFTLPPSLSRSDVSVTMDYYAVPSATATFILRNVRTGKKIATVDGTPKGLEPLTLDKVQGPPYDRYPQFEIITAGKITEAIEHREKGSIFYVTDDPKVLSTLGVSR